MSDFLIDHVAENVWCSPEQDNQHIFKPARLTVPRGEKRFIKVEWDNVELPDTTNVYHVFQVGGVSPEVIETLSTGNTWVTATTLMQTHRRVIDIYFKNGLQLPRSFVYFKKHRNRNLIIAIKEQPRIASLRYNDVFIRLYKNAFFSTQRNMLDDDEVSVITTVVTKTVDAVIFRNKLQVLKDSTKGHVYAFINGFYVYNVNPNTILPGDVLELVHDTTIKRILKFKVSDLETFTSTMDGIRKYLLVREDYENDIIDYKDDVDLFIVGSIDGVMKGLFYHKNHLNTVRMITHKDYSIPVSTIANAVIEQDGWENPLELEVVLHLRHSGYSRPLVFEHNRIHELIRLPRDKKIAAMVGANSTIPEWTAASLESSTYTKLMDIAIEDISSDLVENAYGYNAITKVLADTPLNVVSYNGSNAVFLNPGLYNDSTMFEYDIQGRLVGYYRHNQGEIYFTNNVVTKYVEAIMGEHGLGHGIKFGYDYITAVNNVGWKAYVTDIRGGNPQEHLWRPAEINVDYSFSDNTITWLTDPLETYTALKYDKEFLSKTISEPIIDGVLKFDVISLDEHNEVYKDVANGIKPAKLDVFLNSRPLIENLDYFVNWPTVVISNKEYLNPSLVEQKIVYRTIGFCDNNMDRLPVSEFGFVEHGLLSVNDRFDIRDDKVMRFVVEGRFFHPNELLFSESDNGLRMDNVRNGAPYVIDEIPVPLASYITQDIHVIRDRSVELDSRISDYMTVFYPQPQQPEFSVIPNRYQLVSPFISRIHAHLVSGYLYPDKIENQYSEEDILTWLRRYEWLLEFDPLTKGFDPRYVHVQPHELFTETSLTIYQYNFLQRVANLYFGDKIDLTAHVTIIDGWV